MKLLDRIAASQVNYWGGFVLDLCVSSVAIAAGVAAAGSIALAAIAVGFAAYTLYEYAFHRVVYHAIDNPIRTLHAIHHEDPRARLGAPFFFSLGVAVGTWWIASRIVDGAVAAVFAGTILLLYAFQSAAHHVAHGWAGTAWLGGRLVRGWRRHHMIHHRHGDVNFGIITAFWDHLFGTTARHTTSPPRQPHPPRPRPGAGDAAGAR